MSELDGTRLKTGDKRLAMELLEKCVESAVPMNARVQHLDGVYSVEVKEYRNLAVCVDQPVSVCASRPYFVSLGLT